MSLSPLQFLTSSVVHAGIVLTPAYIYAALKRSKPVAVAASLMLILYMMQAAVLASPSFGYFASLKMNWVQKLAAFLLTLLCAYVLKYSKSTCGFGRPTSGKAFAIAIPLAIVCTVPSLILDYYSGDKTGASNEYILFELFMPGLQEEPFYRGLLLAVWDKAVGRPYKFLGVNVGWGSLISMALFVLGHVCFIDKNFVLQFAPDALSWIDLIFFSIVMTWLRYKYNSVWPGVIAHNLGNVLEALIRPLLSK